MSTKIAVSWRCPKGHNVDDSFSKDELKGRLAAGRLTAVCPHCGGREYPIPAEQQERILKALSTQGQKESKGSPKT
jgi:hypothetical protein